MSQPAPLPPAPAQGSAVRDRTPPATRIRGETHLYGWPLIVARALVLAAIVAVNGLFLLAMPGLTRQLAAPCADAVNLAGPQRCLITPEMAARLTQLGLTPLNLAAVIVVLSCLTLLMVDVIAVVLLVRHSNDWMALLAALTLVLLPPSFTPVRQGLSGNWQTVGMALSAASGITFFLLLGLFPSGRFVPSWLWAPLSVIIMVGLPLPPPSSPALITILALTTLGIVLTLITSQIYRYRRVSSFVQQQQTKWAVYGLVISLLLLMLFWIPFVLIPALNQPDALFVVLKYPAEELAVGVLAATFGVAILRYRLYAIDLLINRSLVYASLTAILAVIYVGSIIGLQAVANEVTRTPRGESSPLVIVATTLLIAALVRPLRRRLQTTIDRRFYRRKYDAARTLETFSATLRNEVDLHDLQKLLLQVVAETTQPTHVSLWLRQPEHAKEQGHRDNAAEPA